MLWLDLCVLAWGQFVGCCEFGHSPSEFATYREFLEHLEELLLSEECMCAIELVICSVSRFDKIIAQTGFLIVFTTGRHWT